MGGDHGERVERLAVVLTEVVFPSHVPELDQTLDDLGPVLGAEALVGRQIDLDLEAGGETERGPPEDIEEFRLFLVVIKLRAPIAGA